MIHFGYASVFGVESQSAVFARKQSVVCRERQLVMRVVVSAVLVALFAVVLLLSVVPAAAFPDELIRCKVCSRAIEHVFRQGAELREHCEDENREDRDARCDYVNLHHFGIEEMVHNVCDDLPKTYQALHDDGDFEMTVHDDPQHAPEVVMALKRTCVKWVHDQGEEVSTYIFGNLDAQKSADVVLPSLVRRFCSLACDPSHKKKRDAHDEL